jgi:hypothetical protein
MIEHLVHFPLNRVGKRDRPTRFRYLSHNHSSLAFSEETKWIVLKCCARTWQKLTNVFVKSKVRAEWFKTLASHGACEHPYTIRLNINACRHNTYINYAGRTLAVPAAYSMGSCSRQSLVEFSCQNDNETITAPQSHSYLGAPRTIKQRSAAWAKNGKTLQICDEVLAMRRLTELSNATLLRLAYRLPVPTNCRLHRLV